MKIRLKNFKGIKAGPELTWDGPDEIEVDFTGKDGLVAFSGENGGGKSTLIENLHHYPQLVSRGGALWQHVMGRVAEKEFISTFMGHEYRSLIKMDSDQGKQEGYLWIDGKSVVNGKITQYKEKVNEIFGQPFTYFRSQFCPQKSKNTQGMQIENMTAGVFRELLQQFLNLQRYAIWEDTSKQAGNILSGQLEQIDRQILILNNKLTGFEDIKTKLTAANADLDAQEQSIKQLKSKRAEYQESMDSLKDKKSQQEVLIAQKANIEAKIKELEDALAREKKDSDAELDTLRETYKGLQAQIKGNEELLKLADEINAAAEKEKEIQGKIESLTGKLDELSMEVPGQNQIISDIETKIATLRQNLKSIETDPENLRLGKLIEDAERTVADKEREISTPSSELATMKSKVEELQRAAQVGEGIDANCQSKTCAAISTINEAKERLPEAKAALQKMVEDVTTRKTILSDEIAEIKKNTAKVCEDKEARLEAINKMNDDTNSDISKANEDLRNAKNIADETNENANKYRKELATLRFDLGKVKDLSARKTALEVSKSQYESVTLRMEENITKGKELKVKWENRKSDLDGSIKDAQASLAEIKIDNNITAGITSIASAITDIEKSLSETETSLNTIRASIMRFESDLSARAEVEKDIETAKERREALIVKISRWRYLQIGCGKTGLQNLRIDGAAPKIIYNANRLLAQAYGARYSVRLETQNEDGKEDLQIKIIMENGKEIYLDDISGGQRAWNVQSLWLAMSLLNQEKSGKKYDYFCSDESDGALDVENAVKYTALYRPFMAEGHLNQLIYISHKPECRSMADHILMFEAGKNPAWN